MTQKKVFSMKCLKLILVVIVLFMTAYGCTDSGVTDDRNSMSPLPLNIVDNNDTLSIHNFLIQKGTTLPSFIKLINDRYDIELKIHDPIESTESSVIAELDGLLYCYADSISEYMKDKVKKYYTLNDFLKNNEVFNTLPEQYRKSLEDENGDIWSLPTQQMFFLDRRVYDETIMDSHNLSVPTTVDELVKLLYDVRAYDSYIKLLTITQDNCLWEFKDILENYGLTVFGTRNCNGIIGWNEEAQRFEDTINNLDADALLDTIDYMRTNSLYEIDKTDSGTAINNAGVFTKITTSSRKSKYMSEPFYNHKEYIFSYESNCILVPLGTRDPEASLNLFVDTFFGSNEGNIYGYHGERGRTVTYDDSFSLVNFLPSTQLVLNEDGSMYFIGLVGPWLNNDYAHWSPKLDAETNERNNQEWSEFHTLFIQKLDNDEIEVLAPYKNLYIDSSTAELQSYTIFNNLFFRYLNEDIDRASFIDKYITEMKKLGAEEFLNNKNENVGSSSIFHYD